jgi:hypothetical protein
MRSAEENKMTKATCLRQMAFFTYAFFKNSDFSMILPQSTL